ncbi:MAG TPA: hypothetical protein VFQ61_39280 [Polyangiaceae bacterium]|nr:hypothetical protein [Polyangiaceae bacterium]
MLLVAVGCGDILVKPVGKDSSEVVGLCAPCESSVTCGDENDYCVLRSSVAQAFCSRDCEDEGECPVGYTCVATPGAMARQCIPDAEQCLPPQNSPSPDELRSKLVERMRTWRSERGLSSFEASACLNLLAQLSIDDRIAGGKPLGKLEPSCRSDSSCECGWKEERQAQLGGYGLDLDSALDASLTTDHVATTSPAAVLDAKDFKQLGIGARKSGDELFVSFLLAQ